MKVLITGAKGFIGKNLVKRLERDPEVELLLFNRSDSLDSLENNVMSADFIFHVAGVNRGKASEFSRGNETLTQVLCDFYVKHHKNIPLVFSSTRHVDQNTSYGSSKLESEMILKKHISEKNLRIYRLDNVFGKWCKPHYNSVVATFCYQIARSQNVTINNADYVLPLIYIDDVVSEFESQLRTSVISESSFEVGPIESITVGELAKILKEFRDMRTTIEFSNLGYGLRKKLYSTYLTYLPTSCFSYEITSHSDERGHFSEFLRLGDFGQISFFTANPKVTRGKHWHDTKTEKFLVVAGSAIFTHECCSTGEVFSEEVSAQDFKVVDTIPGWMHGVENASDEILVVVVWANECFNPDNPDTHGAK